MDKAFEKAVLSTCGAMDAKDKATALRIANQFKAIVDYCTGGGNKLVQMLIDTQRGIVFPVFVQDTVETLVNRYVKLYPTEGKVMLKSFQDDFNGNEAGWTKAKLLKMDARMPQKIHTAGQCLDRQFWQLNDGENYKKFKKLCPKLASRSKNY
jgi:hypothetical protein